MFSKKKDNSADRARFAYFSAKDVQAALEKGLFTTDYQLSLISDEQISELDFSNVPQNIIHIFFPTYSIDDLRGQHSSFGSEFITVNRKMPQNQHENTCLYNEKQLEETSKTQKQKNDAFLKKNIL